MMDEFDKCRFCKNYDSFDGCVNFYPCNDMHNYFVPNKDRIIEKAREKGITVSDVIALFNMD